MDEVAIEPLNSDNVSLVNLVEYVAPVELPDVEDLGQGHGLENTGVVFSHDSRFMFSICDSIIKMISTLSGKLYKELNRHTAPVSGLALNPSNPFQLISASRDGRVMLWDYMESRVTKVIDLGRKIVQVLNGPPGSQSVLLVLETPVENKFFTEITRLDVVSGMVTSLYNKISQKIEKVAYCRDTLAILQAKRCLLWNIKTGKSKSFSHINALANLSFSPTEPVLVLGDSIGRIVSWKYQDSPPKSQFGESDTISYYSTMHWHSYKIKSMTHTSDGLYLLTGGRENVLISWHLTTGQKSFLPRLAGHINGITVSPNQKYYALALGATEVLVINSGSLSKVSRTNRIKEHGHVGAERLSTGLVTIPGTNQVLFNSGPGCVQSYDLSRDAFVFNLTVAPHVQMSTVQMKGGDTPPPIAYNRVLHAAFSSDAQILCTVDRTVMSLMSSHLQTLRLWAPHPQSKAYVEFARVSEPHRGLVTGMAFHPRQNMVASSDDEGVVKIWVPSQLAQDPKSLGPSFFCKASATYKDRPARCLEFSKDGSVLAIAFEETLTLWNPDTMHMLSSMSQPAAGPIRAIKFMADTGYIMTRHDSHVVCWNMVITTAWWSASLPEGSQVIDMVSTPHHFVEQDSKAAAAVSVVNGNSECIVLFFSNSGPEPTQTVHLPTNTHSIALAFSKSPETLHILTNRHEFKAINAETGEITRLTFTQNDPMEYKTGSLITRTFGNAMTKSKNTALEDSAEGLQAGSHAANKNALDLLSAPAHTLPPMAALFDRFAESYVPSSIVAE